MPGPSSPVTAPDGQSPAAAATDALLVARAPRHPAAFAALAETSSGAAAEQRLHRKSFNFQSLLGSHKHRREARQAGAFRPKPRFGTLLSRLPRPVRPIAVARGTGADG